MRGALTGWWRPAPDGDAAAQQISRALDAVLGNVALLVTQLDPDSDANARAWRALNEGRRIREIMRDMGWLPRGGPGDDLRGESAAGIESGMRHRQARSGIGSEQP